MSSVGHAIILLQLTSTVGQLAVADGLPRPARQASNSLPPKTCRHPDMYWNGEECKYCIRCPPGNGSNAEECGYGFGEKGKCVSCVDGATYQEDMSAIGPCKPCTYCDPYATVLSNCTVTQNAICGPCKPGYGSNPGLSGSCNRCILFNDDEKPPECQTTPAPNDPLTTTLPPSTYLPTTSVTSGGASGGTGEMAPSANSDSGNTTLQITTPADSGSSTFPVGATVAGASVGIIILVTVSVIVYSVKRRRPRLPSENGERTTPESGTEEERSGLTTTPNGAIDEPVIVVHVESQEVRYVAPTTSSMANGDLPGQHEPALHDGIAGRTRPDVHSNGGIPTQEIPCTSSFPVDGNENCPKTTDHLSPAVAVEVEETEELLPSVVANGDPPGQRHKAPGCTGPDVLSDTSPPVQETLPPSPGQDVDDYPEVFAQCPTGDDVTDSNGPVQDPPPKEDLPLPTIPEARNIPQSSAGNFKKLKRFKEQAAKTRKRCLSEPADENTPPSSPPVQTDVVAPLQLNPDIRGKIVQTQMKKDENKYKNDLDTACSIGSKHCWHCLSCPCKKNVLQMMTPTANSSVSSYKHFGESFGLNRNTVMKMCKDIDGVFEVLDTKRKELIHKHEPRRNLRSSSQSLLACSSTSTRSYGQRAFSSAAPTLWNKLPNHIKEAPTLDVFKANLKTHLFTANEI